MHNCFSEFYFHCIVIILYDGSFFDFPNECRSPYHQHKYQQWNSVEKNITCILLHYVNEAMYITVAHKFHNIVPHDNL